MQAGQPERYDYEYERSGVRNLLMFVEPLAGWRHVAVTERRTKQNYRTFRGESNLLTPDPAIYFSVTSGSTGTPKMLPITWRSRQAVARANQVAIGFAVHSARQEGRPLGKMLFTNSAQTYGYSP